MTKRARKRTRKRKGGISRLLAFPVNRDRAALVGCRVIDGSWLGS